MKRSLTLSIMAAVLAMGGAVPAQDTTLAPPPSPPAAEVLPTAPIVIDGVELFRVRGTSGLPAERRAEDIARAIREAAADLSAPAELTLSEEELATWIVAGNRRIFPVVDADARQEGLRRPVLARVFRARAQEAVVRYRHDREPGRLSQQAGHALLVTAAYFLVISLGRRGFRSLSRFMDARYRSRVQDVQFRTVEIMRGEQVWRLVHQTLRISAAIVAFLATYAWIDYVLLLFPWTRGAGQNLSRMLFAPLAAGGIALVRFIPDFLFLVVLTLLARFAMRFSRVFFLRVGSGQITLQGFDRDWALPTERIVRFAIVVFALILAYPYIPGSGSEAFKGIGLIIGLMFSLGSPSVIGNLVAGLSLAFRRAFRVGDRVKIGEHAGFVSQVRLLTTYLRSFKNEEIVIPNSLILNSEVVNYSTLAQDKGLILHTNVGIGYETPWRQVEGMLLEAARRTPNVLREPVPFVLQKKLGDFAVDYEINAYTSDPVNIGLTYNALHGNILDVFNEHNVQIMTPAYEGDPEKPKVVPREHWYESPARIERVVEGPAPGGLADVRLTTHADGDSDRARRQ